MIDQDMLNAIESLIGRKSSSLMEHISILEKRIEQQADVIAAKTLNGMQVLLENQTQTQINLIIDELQAMRDAQVAPEEVDALDDRVSTLETVVKVHSQAIDELKKAQ